MGQVKEQAAQLAALRAGMSDQHADVRAALQLVAASHAARRAQLSHAGGHCPMQVGIVLYIL